MVTPSPTLPSSYISCRLKFSEVMLFPEVSEVMFLRLMKMLFFKEKVLVLEKTDEKGIAAAQDILLHKIFCLHKI